MPNSRSVSNPPPAIHLVRHSPVLPGINEPIVISAQVSDRQPVRDVVAWYRVDPATNYAPVPLRDSGLEGDAVAGDGIFSGGIPAQSLGKLVAFYVTASGSDPESPVSLYPAGAPSHECLARVGEPANTNQFGTYRLWLTQSTADRWSRREVTSNDPLEVTFVYDDCRVIHGAGAYYAGSKYNPNYDSPTGRPCDYALVFPEDDLLLGATDFRISWPGNLNSGADPTLQAEQTCFKIVEELGVPYNHRRHVNFFVNGLRRNALLEDSQRPNGEFIDEWFPEDNDGELYKIQVHYEPSSDAATQFSSVRRAGLEQVRLLEGANKPSYYRWNWPKRAVKTTANDYRELFQLIDTANLAETNGYAVKMDALIDVDEWMRIIAAEHFVGNWDSFGYSDGSNMYFYKPLDGKWRLCIWDMDLGLGPVLRRRLNRYFRDAKWFWEPSDGPGNRAIFQPSSVSPGVFASAGRDRERHRAAPAGPGQCQAGGFRPQRSASHNPVDDPHLLEFAADFRDHPDEAVRRSVCRGHKPCVFHQRYGDTHRNGVIPS